MASSIEYKPNKGAAKQLMRGDKAEQLVGNAAAKIASKASGGGAVYGSRTRLQSVSWHGYAFTANYAAMEDNARNDTLNRALGGAG